MNKLTPIFLSSIFLLGNTSVFSADLMQVYSHAASNNLRYKSANVDYQIAEEKKNEILAGYDSELTLKVTPSYNFDGNSGLNSSSLNNSNYSNDAELDYSLGFSKPIYRKKLNYQISQADSILQQEAAILASEKQSLMSRVAENYFDFLITQNKLHFSLLEQNAIKQNLHQVNALYRAKQSTITDIKETESRLDQATSYSVYAKNEVNNARKNLKIMTGMDYDNLATLNTSRQYVKLEPSNIRGWLALAKSNSHEILAATKELDIQEKDIAIQQADNSTTVDLFASYEGVNAIGGSSSNSYSDRDGKVGVEIKIPLYQGDRVRSRIRGANLKARKAQYDLDFKTREIDQNVKFAYQTVMADIDTIHSLQRAVNSSESALKSIRQGKFAGTRTMSDVLSSLRESFLVKREYTKARFTYLLDIVKLKESAGVLSVDDLRLINSLLGAPQNTPQVAYTTHAKKQPVSTEISLEDVWGQY